MAPQGEPDQGGCLLQLLGVQKTVTLKRDLVELVLLDSSTDPPSVDGPGSLVVCTGRRHLADAEPLVG